MTNIISDKGLKNQQIFRICELYRKVKKSRARSTEDVGAFLITQLSCWNRQKHYTSLTVILELIFVQC